MIHVVIGPPCSGKSMFVEANARKGVPRFDFDAVAETVAGMGLAHNIPVGVANPVLAMRAGLMGWLLDETASVGEFWLINGNPSAETMKVLAEAGATFHVLDPGEEVCLARAEEEGWPSFTADQIKAWYADPPVPPSMKGGTRVDYKSLIAEVKAVGDGSTPEFEAYASVFGNRDFYGDVVVKGAFAESLQAWEQKGAPIPLLWGHNMADPDYNIGFVKTAVEDAHGLRVVCQLDVESPKGAQVHRLLKQGRVREMSFAFSTVESEWGDQDGKEVRFLKKVDLHEVSVVPRGANPETDVLAVKSPTVSLAIPDSLAERLIAALEGKAAEDPPPEAAGDDDPDSEEESGFSHALVEGEDDPGKSGESDETKADMARLENLFRAVERD